MGEQWILSISQLCQLDPPGQIDLQVTMQSRIVYNIDIKTVGWTIVTGWAWTALNFLLCSPEVKAIITGKHMYTDLHFRPALLDLDHRSVGEPGQFPLKRGQHWLMKCHLPLHHLVVRGWENLPPVLPEGSLDFCDFYQHELSSRAAIHLKSHIGHTVDVQVL